MHAFDTFDLSNVTATAILGWYAWHTASRTIPDLVAAFRAEMAATRDDFQSERDALRAEIAAERRQRHEDHMAIAQALAELSAHLAAEAAR